MTTSIEPDTTPRTAPAAEWLENVRRHVASLKYGVVQITVHAGRVVQVERTERFRFEAPAAPGSDSNSPAQPPRV